MENVLLKVENLTKMFEARRGALGGLARKVSYLTAVDGINFEIRSREIFGLVGESGSGKTTTGRLVLRLEQSTGGKVQFAGLDLFSLNSGEMKKIRKQMQMIYQNPYESMPERMTVYEIVLEPLSLLGIGEKSEREEMVSKSLESVGLPPAMYSSRYVYELSGGQRQRVAIARALVVLPKFIVADEPVSMLDVSIRAEVLNLLLALRDKFDLTYLFITHDISVARYMCQRIGVMYRGKMMEMGPVESIIGEPSHPYTIALMAATPIPDPEAAYKPVPIKGEMSFEVPKGCRFSARCPYVKNRCSKEEPMMTEIKPDHYVACHFVGALEISNNGNKSVHETAR